MEGIALWRKNGIVQMLHNLQAQSIMLTVNGVAALLGCSPRTVYRLVDRESIPRPVRIGGMIRWPRVSFEQWVTDGCPVPTEAKG